MSQSAAALSATNCPTRRELKPVRLNDCDFADPVAQTFAGDGPDFPLYVRVSE